MKTLSAYNAEWAEKNKKLAKGNKWIDLACDHCGQELAGETSLLMSSPPQQNIYCPSCGWQGRRFVH